MTPVSSVMVAMSGGVDSSVAAALLVEAGDRVVGVTMRLVDGVCAEGQPETACCSLEALHRARDICRQLGVRHYTVDLRGQFRQSVIDDFCNSYAGGETPNPCLRCNEHIKFGSLLRLARASGFDYVATGHYATRGEKGGRQALSRGADRAKDQSYALYGLTQEQLAQVLLPLGSMSKRQVRSLAAERGLPSADVPDSQDLCFVPDGDYRGFLAARLSVAPGPIVDVGGALVGTHQGLHHYTVGQRSGLSTGSSQRLYVVALDRSRNSVMVGPAEAVPRTWCYLREVNWVGREPPGPGRTVCGLAQTRYRSAPTPARLTMLAGGTARAHLPRNQTALAPGQSLVLYQRDLVLGGGIIGEAWN